MEKIDQIEGEADPAFKLSAELSKFGKMNLRKELIEMAQLNPIYTILVPAGMLSIGTFLQSRDKNKTGSDDAIGRLLVTLSPAVTAALDGNESIAAEKRVLTAVRDGAAARLAEIAASEQESGADG